MASGIGLRVEKLAIVRGDRTLVDGLSFGVAPGEVLHLQGRNGAGKTSLLETLSGLRPPAGGRIEGLPEASAQHWLGHKNALNPVLTPVENLRFWCALHGGVAENDVDAALSRVGLKAQRRRSCGQLSTGQRRRAALARLIAVRRPWWFLDEPLAGLDAAGLSLFAELLDEHLAQGGATVITSHQPLAVNAVVNVLILSPPPRTAAAASPVVA
jgi:heme exporter protein A